MLLGAGSCGGGAGSGSGSSVTAPTVPSVQPPAVAVGFTSQPVGWSGQCSSTELGMAPCRLTFAQNGSAVSGTVQNFYNKAGPLSGTVSGNILTFNFSYGNGGNGCGNAVSGTATVGQTTMTGTFSGHDCAGQPVTNGTFTCALEGSSSSPGINQGLLTSSPYRVAGTWNNFLAADLGSGNSTWVMSEEQGDVFQRTFSGSVSVVAGNTLRLGSTSFTGTRTDSFPFLPDNDRVRLNATFGGACPTTVQYDLAFVDGNSLSGNITATTCNGNVMHGTNFFRQ